MRGILAMLATLALMAATGLVAFADGTHFVKHLTTATQSGNELIVSFKEAGLEAGSTETIEVSVNATVTSACVNGGGNIPEDPKKSDGGFTTSGTFTADQNGNIVGSLTVTPTTDLTCPPGQTPTILSVSYAPTATVSDLTSGASITVSTF